MDCDAVLVVYREAWKSMCSFKQQKKKKSVFRNRSSSDWRFKSVPWYWLQIIISWILIIYFSYRIHCNIYICYKYCYSTGMYAFLLLNFRHIGPHVVPKVHIQNTYTVQLHSHCTHKQHPRIWYHIIVAIPFNVFLFDYLSF